MLKNYIKKIDMKMFLVPAIMSVIIVIIGACFSESFGRMIDGLFAIISRYFGWMYDLGLILLVVFCLWAGFSKVGKIRLGGKDAKPIMSMFAWIAVTFTSGMAMGVVFYGVGEGLQHFMLPPGFTGMAGGSAEAAEEALSYVFFHWGLHPYAIYTAAGLGYAFVYWNTKRSFSLTSSLYPLLGEKGENGIWGCILSWLSFYIIVACLGTNHGLFTLQIQSGMNYVFGTHISEALYPVILFALEAVAVICACSGIHKAISHVSKLNMIIFAILLVWAFVFGGTADIINNTFTSIGKYLALLVPESFYLEPAIQSGWISDWTLYYWAWWLVVAPICGLFLAKLAKGRTIREFVLVNLLVPVGFVIVWFGTFGSSAIFKQLGGTDIWSSIQEYGFPVALFAYLKTLPLYKVMAVFAFLAVIFSVLTQVESMDYTMAGMTSTDKTEDENGEIKSPAFLKVFWAAVIGLMSYVLLKAGGLETVQRSVVSLGLPILVILLVNCVSFIKAVRHREVYDLTLSEEDRQRIIKEKALETEEG